MSFKFNFIPGTRGQDNKGRNQAQFLTNVVSIGSAVRSNANGTDYVVGTIQDENGTKRSALFYAKHLAYLGFAAGEQNIGRLTMQATMLPPRGEETIPTILVTSVLVGGSTETTQDEVNEFNAFFGATTPAANADVVTAASE